MKSRPRKKTLWHHVRLDHARKDSVDLYVRDLDGAVEVITAHAPTRKCFFAHVVTGRVADLSFDQQGSPISWEVIRLPAYCRAPEVDSRHNEIIPGYEPTFDDLRCSIANAMNRTINDRGFSRFVKKHLAGVWKAKSSTVKFTQEGTYRVSGSSEGLPRWTPAKGKWFFGSNMLHLMNEEVNAGARLPLVSISEAQLRFHGHKRALFHLYEKEQ